jgi:hypothetical protein
MAGRALFKQLKQIPFITQSSRLALARNNSGGHVFKVSDYPPGLQPGTVDDLPVPHGSWEDKHNELQSKYNKQLIVGLAAFAATIGYLIIGQPIDFVLAPPMKNKK